MRSQITRVLLLLLVAAALPASIPSFSRSLNLGAIEFPTSGSLEAQAHFLRGVGALHSFWYEEALEAFRESTSQQPDFVMGYWGEAMAHNHPVWSEQDRDAARTALDRIPAGAPMTDRERAYLDAVRILYGEGDKEARDRAYAGAMADLHGAYPEDLEAACFYALALLGVGEHETRGSRTHVRAGAVALEVFRRNPDHPCAAHYTIHAFDDPTHAILALPAARRYAAIAPDAHHALHMPAHIFLQLGMWPEAAAANETGWRRSVEWVAEESLPLGLRDYHSLSWLNYVYLQQGRYREAWDVLKQKRADMRAAGTDAEAMATGYERKVSRNYDEMVAHYVTESQEWDAAAELFPPPGADEGWTPTPLALFTTGYAAAKQRASDADGYVTRLGALGGEAGGPPKILAIRKLALSAVTAAARGDLDAALAEGKKAVALEEQLSPPSGPPWTIKPPHELMGELLLAADRAEEAVEYFDAALSRHPGRARSLLGSARTEAARGNRAGAVARYREFLEVWRQADRGRPELAEARRYVNEQTSSGTGERSGALRRVTSPRAS